MVFNLVQNTSSLCPSLEQSKYLEHKMSKNNLRSNHIAKRVILFIDRKYGRILYFKVFFDNDPLKSVKSRLINQYMYKESSSTPISYFFSPSKSKNDSKVGGAFISLLLLLLLFQKKVQFFNSNFNLTFFFHKIFTFIFNNSASVSACAKLSRPLNCL
mgnify:CR=1 FL=1